METINDIIAEMRCLAAQRDWHNHTNQSNRERIQHLADRLEKIVTNCNHLKMREALENITQHFCKNCPNNGPDGCELSKDEGRFEFLCHKLKQARATLATPPRNCDVSANVRDALGAIHNDRGCLQNPLEERKLTVQWLLADAKTTGEESETKGESDENTISE